LYAAIGAGASAYVAVCLLLGVRELRPLLTASSRDR